MSLTGLYPASYLQGSCHRPCPSSHTLVVWFLHIFPDVAPPGITPSWKSSLKPSWTWHPLWLPESHHLHPRVSRPCPLHLETCLPPPILGLGAGAWAETSSRKSGQEVFPGRGRLGAKSGGREGMAGRDQRGWSSEAQRPQHMSLEVTPVQTQREPGPGLSSRRPRGCAGRDRGGHVGCWGGPGEGCLGF